MMPIVVWGKSIVSDKYYKLPPGTLWYWKAAAAFAAGAVGGYVTRGISSGSDLLIFTLIRHVCIQATESSSLTLRYL